MTVLGVLPGYVLSIVAPVWLTPKRPIEPVVAATDLRLLASVALLALTAWGVVRSARGERRLLVAAPWLVVTLLPTLVVPIPILQADRYLYLGLPFVLGAAFAWGGTLREETAKTLRAAAIAWMLALAVISVWYAEAWRSSTALWTHQLERVPSDWRAWYSFGSARMNEDDPAGARQCYEQVLVFQPEFLPAQEAIAAVDVRTGHADRAELAMLKLLQSSPGYANAWIVLAEARAALGRIEQARQTYREALAAFPGDEEIVRNAAFFEQRHPAR
jgi:tetratricopeptide (TPR) repeat protein